MLSALVVVLLTHTSVSWLRLLHLKTHHLDVLCAPVETDPVSAKTALTGERVTTKWSANASYSFGWWDTISVASLLFFSFMSSMDGWITVSLGVSRLLVDPAIQQTPEPIS